MAADPTDPGRLLPGEQTSITSGNLDDVKHWVTVYAELVHFKDGLLDELHTQRGRVTHDGQPELDNDEKLLMGEAVRLKRRLAFWKERLDSYR